MTIVVVMLSSTDDIRKVMVASSHSRRVFFRVVICLVMTSKPPWVSMMSTMAVGIDDVHDSHGTDKEDQYLTSAA